MDKTTLRARIQERLTATGKTAHAVSIEIGAGQGYIRDLLDPSKGGYPRADKLNALARALGTTADFITGVSANPRQIESEAFFVEDVNLSKFTQKALPGIPLVGTGDCAVLAITDAEGRTLEIERCSFDADHTLRLITRPPALAGNTAAYAIYFHGESMMPRFEPGEVGIVDPTRPSGPGDYVLVQLCDGESDEVTSVLVKRLVRANAREIELEQFNPPMRFVITRDQVARLHRIVPSTELLFG